MSDRVKIMSYEMSADEVLDLALGVRSGAAEFEVLRAKRAAVQTVRVRSGDGRSLILKIWDTTGVHQRIRGVLGTSNPAREWRALRRLWDTGVAVPTPLGRARITDRRRPGRAIAVADLGKCERVGDVLPTLVRDAADDEIRSISDGLITIMEGMASAGVMDSDNTTTNYLLPPGGGPVRVDLEMARVVGHPTRRPNLYGTTIGRLIASFTFAVQAEPHRAESFAREALDRLEPPRNVRTRALDCLRQGLEKQRRDKGITVHLDLPWPT